MQKLEDLPSSTSTPLQGWWHGPASTRRAKDGVQMSIITTLACRRDTTCLTSQQWLQDQTVLDTCGTREAVTSHSALTSLCTSCFHLLVLSRAFQVLRWFFV